MLCEQCHTLMIERPVTREMEDAHHEQAIVLECPQCGHTEYQPVIASFWRRSAASFISFRYGIGRLPKPIRRIPLPR